MTPNEQDRSQKPICEFIEVPDTLVALEADSDDLSSQNDDSLETEMK